MQTMKGLIALVVVALVVFFAVEAYNRRAEANYIPQWKKHLAAASVKDKRIEIESSGLATTNKIARHKIKNANL